VDGWRDIVAIAAGSLHTVGLKADGTVVATGDNAFGQCEVGDWRGIVAVAAGCAHTVGLKADGTVVATGDNAHGQCEVGGWSDIRLPDRSQQP
jgi:alpha-tubulin suppressor-like RCC1 family protein